MVLGVPILKHFKVTLKAKNLLIYEQVLSFRSRPHFKELCHSNKLTGTHTSQWSIYHYISFKSSRVGRGAFIRALLININTVFQFLQFSCS